MKNARTLFFRTAILKFGGIFLFDFGVLWFGVLAVYGLWNLDIIALSRSLIGVLAYKLGMKMYRMHLVGLLTDSSVSEDYLEGLINQPTSSKQGGYI